MKKQINLRMFVLLILTGFTLTNCSKTTTDPAPIFDPVLVKLANSATLGSYLTDKDGNALYFYSNDANGENNCTSAQCISAWPIFNIAGLTAAQLGTGLTFGDFNAISTPNGNQLTYKGWPLYYYAPGGVREAPNLTTGDAIGNVWYVAKPDYSIMLANAQLVGKDGKNYIVSTTTNVYTEGVGKTLYFTDPMGRTLYEFAHDSLNINKYTTTDAVHNAVWPIYETDKMIVPSFLDKSLFNTTTKYSKTQLTYKGWPMYYYGPDVNTTTGKYRGSNMGISVPLPGVLWPAFLKDIPAAPHK